MKLKIVITPKVSFSYNKNKDVENINIGLRMAHQGRKPDPEIQSIIMRYGEKPSDDELLIYITEKWDKKNHIIKLITEQLQEYWSIVNDNFFYLLIDQMQLESFFNINNFSGFFSSRYGCGYNIKENWFAVSLHNSTLRNTMITMHEMMHVFFHHQWWKFCKEENVPEKNIWDIKEATTILLNLWFSDILIDVDQGYGEHADLRNNIKNWFLRSHNFRDTLKKACEFMKNHSDKSPHWLK